MGKRFIKIVSDKPSRGQSSISGIIGKTFEAIFFHPDNESVTIESVTIEVGKYSPAKFQINRDEYEWS